MANLLPELAYPPIRVTSSSFSGRQKRHFARMTEKIRNDDNDCCHDNFDQNCDFDDNYDKKILKNLPILLILGKILPFRDY